MSRLFKNCKTVAEIKKEYHRLAIQNHPDRGGSKEAMQRINAEYLDALRLMDGETTTGTDEKYHTYHYSEETERDLIDKINELLNLKMKNTTIELIGSWIWISGETIKYKEELKAAKCRWHSKRKVWYFHKGGRYRSRNSKKSLEELRDIYGTKTYTDENKSSDRKQQAINV